MFNLFQFQLVRLKKIVYYYDLIDDANINKKFNSAKFVAKKKLNISLLQVQGKN